MKLSHPVLGLAALVLLGAAAMPVMAATPSDHYASWKAAHPDPEAAIAALKIKTAALVTAAMAQENAAQLPPDALLAAKPTIWRVPGAIADLIDCPDVCPEMVVIPAGSYTMGSPALEMDRQVDEGPLHRVRISYPLAVGKYGVTVAEFARFVADTKYDAGNSCWTSESGKNELRSGRNWREPGFPQVDTQPVVCVNWDDAQAYVAWLSKRAGHAYRLLTEAEYEYANRAGTTTAYWWGDSVGRNNANCDGCGSVWDNKQTAPVGSFSPNPFGLYDTAGNVWSWTQDCYRDSYAGAPVDGSASTEGDCGQRVMRAGFWPWVPKDLRTANRARNTFDGRRNGYGFRVARGL